MGFLFLYLLVLQPIVLVMWSYFRGLDSPTVKAVRPRLSCDEFVMAFESLFLGIV